MNQSQGAPGAAQGQDRLSASILTAGLVATVAVGAPFQFVLPETIKSVVAALFALAALAIFAWQLRRVGVLRWSFFLAVPFGLAVAALLSTAWAPTTSAVTEAVRWAVMGVIAAVGANVLRSSDVALVARRAHLAALLVSVLALLQFWLDFSWFPAGAAPGGNFGNRNFLAELIATVLPFSCWLLMRETSLKRALARGAGLGIIVLALFATGTRSALIATGVLAVLTLVFVLACRFRGVLDRTNIRNLLSGLAVAVAMLLTLGWIPSNNSYIIKENVDGSRGLTPLDRSAKRFSSLFHNTTYAEGTSFGIRRSIWGAGAKMMAAKPLLGVGAGAWNTTVPLYLPETIESEQVWLAHNEPLQLVTEYGVAGWAGLLAIAWLVVAALATVVNMLVRKADMDRAPDVWAPAVSVLMFGIVSLSGLPLHAASTCYILALCFGLLVAGRQLRRIDVSGRQARPWLATGQVAAVGALAVAAIVSIQGMRADMYVQEGSKAIQAILQNKSLSREAADNMRIQAVGALHHGFDIYSDHGYVTVSLAHSLSTIQDPASVIWLSNLMLQTRPHVVSLKCNQVRAYADLGNFAAANQVLDVIKTTRPLAPCRPLSEFVYAFRQGQFATALALGQKMIAALDETTEPEIARYVVDTSYRAAIRVPAVDAAVEILRVRAERWPELRSASWLLAGQLLASRSPADQVAPEALAAFRRSLTAASAQERIAVLGRVPENYRRQVEQPR